MVIIAVPGEFRCSNLPVAEGNVESPTLTKGYESTNAISHIRPICITFYIKPQ